MAAHVATAQSTTLQGESTAQQRTPPAILARRLVTGNKSAGSLMSSLNLIDFPTSRKVDAVDPFG